MLPPPCVLIRSLWCSLLLAAASAEGAVFTVTSPADGGPGTLREAVALAAAAAGADTIVFGGSSFPGGGTVDLASALTIPAAGDTAGLTVATTVGAGNVNVAVNAGTLTVRPGLGWTGTGRVLLGGVSGAADAVLQLQETNVTLGAPITVRGGSSGLKTIRLAGPGATAVVTGDIKLDAPLTIEKTFGLSDLDFQGDVNLGLHLLTMKTPGGGGPATYFTGRVFRDDPGNEPARMKLLEFSVVVLRGSGDNTRLAVETEGREGWLELDKQSSAGVHAVGSGLAPGTVALTCTMQGRSTSGDQIADGAAVQLNSIPANGGSGFQMGQETIGALSGTGVVMGGPLVVGAGGGSGSFSGSFTDGSPVSQIIPMSLTKAGAGTQTMAGTTDFLRFDVQSGITFPAGSPVTFKVSGGVLNVTGAYHWGDGALVESGGTLAGNGEVHHVTLASGGLLAPGNALTPGTPGRLGVTNWIAPTAVSPSNEPGTLTWHGGGVARFDLGATASASDRVEVQGQFIKGSAGALVFDFQGSGTPGITYPLITFAGSTGFSPGDFSYVNLAPGLSGTLTLTPAALTFTTTGVFSSVVTSAADSGTGSLRHVLAGTAAHPGPDTITFAPELDGATITLTDEIVINDPAGVTVDGASVPGGIVVDGGHASHRLFSIAAGSSVALRSLVLTGGDTLPGGSGGALQNAGSLELTRCTVTGNGAHVHGGAIYNTGSLQMVECSVSGNGLRGETGGALRNEGTALARRCAFYENFTGSRGGAISSAGPLTLEHCTLVHNNGEGGGAAVDSTGTLTLRHCTVVDNEAGGEVAAGIVNNGNAASISYSIIAGNYPGEINGPVNGNRNLIGAGLPLAPAGNYGGPTVTVALPPGSPARDAALGSSATADQRNHPVTGVPDIGAYEAGGVAENFNAFIWESLPGGASAPEHSGEGDFDRDGQSNFDEWLALTDPASAGSVFAPVVTTGPDGAGITFTTAPGRTYQLRRSTDLRYWDAPAPPVTGDGTEKRLPVPKDEPRSYFQVVPSVP